MREYVTGKKVSDPFGGISLAECSSGEALGQVFVPVAKGDPEFGRYVAEHGNLYFLQSGSELLCRNVFEIDSMEAAAERSRYIQGRRYSWARALYFEGDGEIKSASCVLDSKEGRVVYVMHPDDKGDMVICGNVLANKKTGVIVYLPSMETVYVPGCGEGEYSAEKCGKYMFLRDCASECSVFVRVDVETGVVRNLLEE